MAGSACLSVTELHARASDMSRFACLRASSEGMALETSERIGDFRRASCFASAFHGTSA
jgi:hypothetical protein